MFLPEWWLAVGVWFVVWVAVRVRRWRILRRPPRHRQDTCMGIWLIGVEPGQVRVECTSCGAREPASAAKVAAATRANDVIFALREAEERGGERWTNA